MGRGPGWHAGNYSYNDYSHSGEYTYGDYSHTGTYTSTNTYDRYKADDAAT